MPSRQFHSKNRHGCIPCKRRRVKCNLARPICSNCARRNEACTLSPDPTTAHAEAGFYPVTGNDSFSTLLRPLNPDLYFLERYFSHICPTLSSRPETQRNWAQAATDSSKQQPHYLTHLQIAISELHFCLTNRDSSVVTLSERKKYQQESVYHQNAAISMLHPLLGSAEEMRTRGLEQVTALFSTAWLIFLFNLAFPRDGPTTATTNKEWILDEILALSELSKGVVAIMLGASAGITTSTRSILHCTNDEDDDAKTRVMSGPLRPFFNHLLPWKHQAIPPSVRRQNLSSSAQTLFRTIESMEFSDCNLEKTTTIDRKQLYRLAIEELAMTAVAMKVHTQHPSFIFMWLIGTKREFMELVKERDGYALRILREYGLMLKMVESHWWARGLERTIVEGVDSALSRDMYKTLHNLSFGQVLQDLEKP